MDKNKEMRIIVLGGGTAGWVTGAVLAKNAARNNYAVTVVDTADIPTIGVGEASIPTIYDLFRHLGMEDAEVFKSAAATFKYGIQFEGWSRSGEQYMHGFGNLGTDYGDTEFFSAWLGAARFFSSRDLGPFAPAVVAAQKGRFTRVVDRPADAPPGLYFPLCELSYALHFDASMLARLLREKALNDGATHFSRHVATVETGEHGITALVTEDGERLEADFFVDCSGMRGVLGREALGEAFEDWSQFLPCNAAIAMQTERSGPPNLFTRSVAHNAGWRWEIQLQHRTGNGCVYCTDHMSDDEATALLLRDAVGTPLTEPRKIAFRTGRLKEPWQGNCVAIGLSAGFLEPLESTSIHLICEFALMLERLLAPGIDRDEARSQFNRTWNEQTDDVRDFLMAHYVVNHRDEPFWRARRDGPRPASLDRKLDSLREKGWMDVPAYSLFGHDSWFQVLVGQGFELDYSRFALDPTRAQKIMAFLQNVGSAIASESDRIPRTHQQMIDQLLAD